jgi:hypothetical protein
LSKTPKQARLLNGKLLDRWGPLKPPRGCTNACYFATTDRDECRCSCGGLYHGIGRANQLALMQKTHKVAEPS